MRIAVLNLRGVSGRPTHTTMLRWQDFCLVLRLGFPTPAADASGAEEHTRRRNILGENPFGGGSDPAWRGFQPPNVFGDGGRHRQKWKPARKESPISTPRGRGAQLLQRYAAFLDGATHYVIGESLKRLFRRDREFNQWLVKNEPVSRANSEPQNATVFNLNTAARTAPSAA